MEEKKYQLISIGDASWDVFITPSESETLCKLDDKESLLCFDYGDKIPVDNLEFSIGGNAANNAVGTKRLGVNVAVILTIGDDEIADQMVNKFIKEGVGTDYVFRTKNTPSNYSTAITVAGERTLFTYKSPKSYRFPDVLPKTDWVYLTSMGEGFEEIYERVVNWVDEEGVKLAYNPGSRQLRAGVEKSLEVLKRSTVLYVNRKEAELFADMQNSKGKEKELLDRLTKLGPKIPIVTDGGGGSFAFDGAKYLHCGVLPVDSYERTGAGDSFGSGCVSALIKGQSVLDALLIGTVNSASVIGYAGAQRGLLKYDELSVWIERAKSSGVEIVEF